MQTPTHRVRPWYSLYSCYQISSCRLLIATDAKETNVTGKDNDIPIITVIMRAQSPYNEHCRATPDILLDETTDPNLPTVNGWLNAQRTDDYSVGIRPTLEMPRSTFIFDKNGLLLRISPLDAAIQKPILKVMCSIILHLAHQSTFAGNSGECWMYDKLRRECFWPNSHLDVYNTVQHC